jgi:tRNA(Glu) U13 pseudouridine synthase TruD
MLIHSSFRDGNAVAAYEQLPNHMMVEKAVMGALSRRCCCCFSCHRRPYPQFRGFSKDWAGAIAAVPRAMRTMYVLTGRFPS